MARFPDHKELLHCDVVFFDLDNTLYPYEPAHQPSLNLALKVFGQKYKLTEEYVRTLYKEARTAIHERLHGQASSHSRLLYFKEMLHRLERFRNFSDALKFEKLYWDHFLSVMSIDPEALQLIRDLHRKKISMGIITDLTTQIQLQKMKRLKIEKYFRHIITSEEAGVEKPAPAIFKQALQVFNTTADKAVMIGDNPKTDKGAETIGIQCFIIPPYGNQ